ncbi:MAG: hypothetical protein KA715_03315 [Xanthomonadaceae bacterium]|nr:hypothetical protein [Xanthomonadaceae bacterium]
MKKASIKQINDSRHVSGLLKEALYSKRPVVLEFKDKKIVTEIVEVIENSTRERNETRYVVFKQTNEAASDTICTARIGFPKFSAEFKLEFASTSELKSVIPNDAQLLNHRDDHNHRVKLTSGQTHEVVLNTDNIHTLASLNVIDLSRTGVGCTIEVSSQFPITNTTRVTGTIKLKSGAVELNGLLMRSEVIEKQSDTTLYQAGILQEVENNKKPDEGFFEHSERRLNTRWETKTRLSIRSDLTNSLEIEGTILNASVVGFLWEPELKTHSTLFPIGYRTRVLGTTLGIQVVGFIGNSIRFEIVEGTTSDRVHWLKYISTSMLDNLTAQTYDPEALLDLFCVSGAFAAGFVKNLSNRKASTSQSLYSDIMKLPWIHRWIESSENGIHGHISAVQVGDNYWFTSDVAGSIDKSTSLSKNFIPLFLRSFTESCMQSIPRPKILCVWKKITPFGRVFSHI